MKILKSQLKKLIKEVLNEWDEDDTKAAKWSAMSAREREKHFEDRDKLNMAWLAEQPPAMQKKFKKAAEIEEKMKKDLRKKYNQGDYDLDTGIGLPDKMRMKYLTDLMAIPQKAKRQAGI